MQLTAVVTAIALMGLPLADSKVKDLARQHKILAVQKEWLNLHWNAKTAVDAQLVIDPRVRGMWIETGGQVRENSEVALLPQATQWTAFYITNRGITERSFPLRIRTPRSETDDEQGEIIYIIGASEENTWVISMCARKTGHMFHAGHGSKRGDIKLRLEPRHAPADEREAQFNSILAAQSPWKAKWSESHQTEHFKISIERVQQP